MGRQTLAWRSAAMNVVPSGSAGKVADRVEAVDATEAA